MELIMIILGIPMAIVLFSIIRSKIDPDYKERIEQAKQIQERLINAGYNDTMIEREIQRQDLEIKHKQKMKSQKKNEKPYGQNVQSKIDTYFEDFPTRQINNNLIYEKGSPEYEDNLSRARGLAAIFFQAALDNAETFEDFLDSAESISANDGDKEWAREVYNMAFEKAKNLNEYTKLAKSIANEEYLNDKKWAEEIIKIAKEQ